MPDSENLNVVISAEAAQAKAELAEMRTRMDALEAAVKRATAASGLGTISFREFGQAARTTGEQTLLVQRGLTGIGLQAPALAGAATAMRGLGAAVTSVSGPLAVVIAAFAALAAAIDVVKMGVSTAAQWQDAMFRLGIVVKNQGGDWASLQGHIAAWAKTQEETTRFSRTEAVGALEILKRSNMDLADAQKTVRIAEDVARVTGMSLTDVTEGLMKSETGRATILSALGINVSKLRKEHMDFNDVLKLVADNMGGAATKGTNQLQDAWDRLKNSMHTFAAESGKNTVPALVSIIDHTRYLFEVGLPEFNDTLQGLFNNLTQYFRAVSANIMTAMAPVLDMLAGHPLDALVDSLKKKSYQSMGSPQDLTAYFESGGQFPSYADWLKQPANKDNADLGRRYPLGDEKEDKGNDKAYQALKKNLHDIVKELEDKRKVEIQGGESATKAIDEEIKSVTKLRNEYEKHHKLRREEIDFLNAELTRLHGERIKAAEEAIKHHRAALEQQYTDYKAHLDRMREAGHIDYDTQAKMLADWVKKHGEGIRKLTEEEITELARLRKERDSADEAGFNHLRESLDKRVKLHLVAYEDMIAQLRAYLDAHKTVDADILNDWTLTLQEIEKEHDDSLKRQADEEARKYDEQLKKIGDFAEKSMGWFDKLFEAGKKGAGGLAAAFQDMIHQMERALEKSILMKLILSLFPSLSGGFNFSFGSILASSLGLGSLAGAAASGGGILGAAEVAGAAAAGQGIAGSAALGVSAAGLGSTAASLGSGALGVAGFAALPTIFGGAAPGLLGADIGAIGAAGLAPLPTIAGGTAAAGGGGMFGLGGLGGLLGKSISGGFLGGSATLGSLALAGLGGYLGANLLFGGRGYSGIGGGIGAIIGALSALGPIGAIIGAIGGGFLGSLFHKDDPSKMPDKYLAGYGQFVSDVNGAPGTFNGQVIPPDAGFESPNNIASRIANYVNGLTPDAFAHLDPALQNVVTRLKSLNSGLQASGWGIASEKDGFFTLGSGARIAVSDYMSLVDQFMQGTGGAQSAGSGDTPVFDIKHVFPDFTGAIITKAGDYVPGGPSGGPGSSPPPGGGKGGSGGSSGGKGGSGGGGGGGHSSQVVVNVYGSLIQEKNLADHLQKILVDRVFLSGNQYIGRSG